MNETGAIRRQKHNRFSYLICGSRAARGAWAASCSRPSPMAPVPSVGVGPGLIALTRTPLGRYSAAQAFVNSLTADLLEPHDIRRSNIP